MPAECYSVSTDATSKVDLRLLTEHFRAENPGAPAVVVASFLSGQGRR